MPVAASKTAEAAVYKAPPINIATFNAIDRHTKRTTASATPI